MQTEKKKRSTPRKIKGRFINEFSLKTHMHPKQRIDLFESLSGFFLFFVLALIVITAVLGEHNLFFVVIGFLPTILVVLVSLTIHEHYAEQKKLLWMVPLVIIGICFSIGSASPAINKQLDVHVLVALNLILSLFYALVASNLFTAKTTQPAPLPQTSTSPEQSIESYIHSIEDKSKALNFVVGRVYNKYHGGTSDMRDKLRIPAEWYNEFSSLGVGTNHIDAEKLNALITRFEKRLSNYEKQEFILFASDAYQLKNLIRDPHGKDSIIAVLDHNDKDPVRTYYEGALAFCKKVREAIANESLELVKNDYVPKEDEKEKTPISEQVIEKKEKEKEGPKHP